MKRSKPSMSAKTGHIVEELGDVLFQVVFHCQIAREQGEFTMADVLQAVIQKMTRRHPSCVREHRSSELREALRQWEQIRRTEAGAEGTPRSALDGVPKSLPSLLRAQRLQVKAGRVGLRLANVAGSMEQGARGDGGSR